MRSPPCHRGSPHTLGCPRFVPVGSPDLQCPQLLLQPPHLPLQVQVLHREGAHVLGEAGKKFTPL